MKNTPLKLNEARKALKEWSFVPISSIRKAIKAGLIPHMKSGLSSRASTYVTVENLRKYFETLRH